MDLRDAINVLCELEESVTISEPVELKIARSYPFRAPGKDALDLPCFMHPEWTLLSVKRYPNSQRERRYSVRSQCLIADSMVEPELNSEIAAAFDTAYLNALDRKVNFGGQIFMQSGNPVQGNEPTFGRLEWDGEGFVGLDYQIEIIVNDDAVSGP